MPRTLRTLLVGGLLAAGALVQITWAEPEYRVLAEGTKQYPRNDSASIVELQDGRLFMVWMEFFATDVEGGRDDGLNRIVSMTSDDGGRTWKNKRVELETNKGDKSVYNPALLKLANGDVLFTFIRYHRLEWGAPYVISAYARRSVDEAKTFSDPVIIFDHLPMGMGSDRLIQLSTGRVILSIDRMLGPRGQKAASESGCYYSDDNARTWKMSESVVRLPMRGAMESIIAETKDHELVMAMRTQLGSVFLSRSTDAGVHWSKAQTSGQTSPESMPILRRVPLTGDLVLIWNNSEYDPGFVTHYGPRSPLTIAVSTDGGRTWAKNKNIETDPTYEFSNPSCLFTKSGSIIITYFTSKMIKAEGGTKFGGSSMSLKAFIGSVDWLYEKDLGSRNKK
ncbi:MAG: sialidase family protein [Opitutae bacterium]|nr:sialidase family protein [Opitutae bacterium]